MPSEPGEVFQRAPRPERVFVLRKFRDLAAFSAACAQAQPNSISFSLKHVAKRFELLSPVSRQFIMNPNSRRRSRPLLTSAMSFAQLPIPRFQSFSRSVSLITFFSTNATGGVSLDFRFVYWFLKEKRFHNSIGKESEVGWNDVSGFFSESHSCSNKGHATWHCDRGIQFADAPSTFYEF